MKNDGTVPAPPSNSAPIETILIADDDDDARGLMALGLRRAGFGVREVTNGRELLETHEAMLAEADGAPVAILVVSDIHMPECDGVSAAAQLLKRHPECPVVLVTADAGCDLRREAVDVGVRCVMAKPVDTGWLAAFARSLFHS